MGDLMTQDEPNPAARAAIHVWSTWLQHASVCRACVFEGRPGCAVGRSLTLQLEGMTVGILSLGMWRRAGEA